MRAVSGLDYATRFITRICRIAGDHRMLDHIRRDLSRCGVRAAVRGRNTPALFDWLLEMVSYQGIGNHVADGDLVDWLDRRLADADLGTTPDRAVRLREAVVEPLAQVHGVSDKVLSMALANLLLGADRRRVLWTEAGAVMIAVDTLVHNFLHRTGILARLDAAHLCGPACYAPGGCTEIVERIAGNIDARHFNPAFPANFPRFVQHAIWRFCAEYGLDECNGRQIDDRRRCDRRDCPVFRSCDRMTLKPERNNEDD
jgi:hypothetical protein